VEDFVKAAGWPFFLLFSVVSLAPSKYLSCLLLFLFVFFVAIFLFYVAAVNTA